jgi:thiamine pyrophosphokinase
VVAADSGFDHAREAGLCVDLVIGDMDSVKTDPVALGMMTQLHPRDKDHTDTELAVEYCRKAGAQTVTLVGGGGGRLDHSIALYQLFFHSAAPELWISDNALVHRLGGRLVFPSRPGQTVSVFNASKEAAKVNSLGLYWPLDGLDICPGFNGLSNRATGPLVELEVLCGICLIIRSLGELDYDQVDFS